MHFHLETAFCRKKFFRLLFLKCRRNRQLISDIFHHFVGENVLFGQKTYRKCAPINPRCESPLQSQKHSMHLWSHSIDHIIKGLLKCQNFSTIFPDILLLVCNCNSIPPEISDWARVRKLDNRWKFLNDQLWHSNSIWHRLTAILMQFIDFFSI